MPNFFYVVQRKLGHRIHKNLRHGFRDVHTKIHQVGVLPCCKLKIFDIDPFVETTHIRMDDRIIYRRSAGQHSLSYRSI